MASAPKWKAAKAASGPPAGASSSTGWSAWGACACGADTETALAYSPWGASGSGAADAPASGRTAEKPCHCAAGGSGETRGRVNGARVMANGSLLRGVDVMYELKQVGPPGRKEGCLTNRPILPALARRECRQEGAP